MQDRYDVIVIGAGPAGMAAACTAAAEGAATLLLDENAGPGGQIYRAIGSTPVKNRNILGSDYWAGETWLERLKRSAVVYRPRTAVWSLAAVEGGVEIGLNDENGASLLRARQVIVATGAMERPMPVPGWTLPGVMTVGAAQSLLKSSGMVPQGETVLAGTGPLLYLFARQLIEAGAAPALILDTTPKAQIRSALAYLPSFIASRYFFKGIGMVRSVARRVPVMRWVKDLRIEGSDRATEIGWLGSTTWQKRRVDTVLLHQGVVPTINLWSAAGCRAVWNDVQACWHAEVDAWGDSSVPGILVAGDGVGIGGAEIAAVRGLLAGLQASHRCGYFDATARDLKARPALQAFGRLLRGREFIDRGFLAPDWARVPKSDTLVCRCEEITAGQLAAAATDGASNLSKLKAFSRCGMGPCQGRQCGLTVTELMARTLNRPPAEIGHFRLRPPIKPISLADMAKLPATPAERASVIRL